MPHCLGLTISQVGAGRRPAHGIHPSAGGAARLAPRRLLQSPSSIAISLLLDIVIIGQVYRVRPLDAIVHCLSLHAPVAMALQTSTTSSSPTGLAKSPLPAAIRSLLQRHTLAPYLPKQFYGEEGTG